MPAIAFQKAARFFGPFSMFLLLTMSIFFSSGYLLQGIAEEKQKPRYRGDLGIG